MNLPSNFELQTNSRVRERYCPYCEGKKYSLYKQVTVDNTLYNIVECSNCQFVYVRNPDDTTIAPKGKQITKLQIKDIEQAKSRPAKKRHYQIKRLLDHYFQDARNHIIVEIGPGNGELGKLLAQDEKYEYYGFEPSPIPAQVCQSNSLKVKNDFFNLETAAQFVAQPIDAIVLDNVLEHVYDPRTMISEAAQSLVPGGILAVIVPNLHDIRKIYPKWSKKFWIPRDHINYFTSQNLKSLFEEYGLTFQSFGWRSLELKSDRLFIPKVALDNIGIYLLGLYCCGIKSAKK